VSTGVAVNPADLYELLAALHDFELRGEPARATLVDAVGRFAAGQSCPASIILSARPIDLGLDDFVTAGHLDEPEHSDSTGHHMRIHADGRLPGQSRHLVASI
jgi:hypothetical protein